MNETKPVITELIYGALFAPASTFRRISGDPPLFYSFIVFLAVLVLTSLVQIVIPQQVGNLPPELADALSGTGPYLGIIGAVFSVIGWFIQAGVFQVFAELFGGRGRAAEVLTVLAFASVPGVVIIPFRIFSYYTPDSLLISLLTMAVTLAVIVWRIAILTIGLRETHQFSTGKALAAIFVPGAVILLAAGILAASLIGLFVPFLNQVF